MTQSRPVVTTVLVEHGAPAPFGSGVHSWTS